MTSRLLIAGAIAALALTGCDFADDGPRTTQTRDVAPFSRIDNKGSVDVRLHVGSKQQKVKVWAGEKVIDDVTTEVRDGTLVIAFDHSGWGGNDVTVEASMPTLAGIETSGSGDIDADGIENDGFELLSEGSADITLAGATQTLAVELEGSGNADLAGLRTQQATVKVRGSGDVDVRADDRLNVDVDGSGDVRYHGAPELTQHVDGSGDLTHVE